MIHYIGIHRHMICIPCWVAFSWLAFESFWVLTSFEPVKFALIVDWIESASEVSLLFLYPFCSYVVQSTSKYTYGKWRNYLFSNKMVSDQYYKVDMNIKKRRFYLTFKLLSIPSHIFSTTTSSLFSRTI